MRYAYFGFNVFVLVPCLIISLRFSIGPTKKWRQLLAGYGTISLIFIVWDILASAAGHWGFSTRYAIPFRFVGLPIEEYLFFFTVPFACMLVWDMLSVSKARAQKKYLLSYFSIWWLLSAGLLIFGWERGYTRAAALSVLLTSGLLMNYGTTLLKQQRFLWYQATVLFLFIVCNMYLTALPIITYGSQAIMGWRFVTIPIEDFLFNFALLNTFLLVYERSSGWPWFKR